jgi:bis(5'-nucleosyl)-tetraphosphatase (symmetrical)
MPTYAIGDLQGCYDELQVLLARLRFDPTRDRLWFAGDLVNRGPQSLECLRFVRSLGNAAVTVLGNHDLHLLAIALVPGTKPKSKDTLEPILTAPDRDELLDWLRHRPLLHRDPHLQHTLIHAGLPPQWDIELAAQCAQEVEHALRDTHDSRGLLSNMYGDQPDRWSDALTGYERLRFITNCLTRMRFCDAGGRLDLKRKGTINDAPQGQYPWFRVPGRRSQGTRIVCGHWSALGFYEGEDVLAIDTGCVWGGSLCAARLDRRELPILVPCTSSGLKIGDE